MGDYLFFPSDHHSVYRVRETEIACHDIGPTASFVDDRNYASSGWEAQDIANDASTVYVDVNFKGSFSMLCAIDKDFAPVGKVYGGNILEFMPANDSLFIENPRDENVVAYSRCRNGKVCESLVFPYVAKRDEVLKDMFAGLISDGIEYHDTMPKESMLLSFSDGEYLYGLTEFGHIHRAGTQDSDLIAKINDPIDGRLVHSAHNGSLAALLCDLRLYAIADGKLRDSTMIDLHTDIESMAYYGNSLYLLKDGSLVIYDIEIE